MFHRWFYIGANALAALRSSSVLRLRQTNFAKLPVVRQFLFHNLQKLVVLYPKLQFLSIFLFCKTMLCEVIKTIYGKFKKSKKKYRAKLKIKSQSLTLSFFFVSLDKLYASICTESKTFYKVLFESLTAKVILPFRFNSIFFII